MDVKHKKHESPKEQMVDEPGSDSDTAQSTLEHGAEVLGQAEEAVSDAYDKTAQAVSETYEKAKSYSSKNPGKVSLGCKRSSLGHHRPVCQARGQRALRHCSGDFPLNHHCRYKAIVEDNLSIKQLGTLGQSPSVWLYPARSDRQRLAPASDRGGWTAGDDLKFIHLRKGEHTEEE